QRTMSRSFRHREPPTDGVEQEVSRSGRRPADDDHVRVEHQDQGLETHRQPLPRLGDPLDRLRVAAESRLDEVFGSGVGPEELPGVGAEAAPRDLGLPAALSPAGTVELLGARSEEHTSELQSRENLVCRLLLEKKTVTTATLT